MAGLSLTNLTWDETPPLLSSTLGKKSLFSVPLLYYFMKSSISCTPSHIGSLLHYSLWSMITFHFLWLFTATQSPWSLNFSLYSVFLYTLFITMTPNIFTPLNCLSKKRYIIVPLLNIFVHLDITLWLFSWQNKFNMMKAVHDFLTWIPYLLNFPGRSYLL